MYFRVLDHDVRLAADAKDSAYLLTDNWDNWFKYNTMYTLVVYDEDGRRSRPSRRAPRAPSGVPPA